MGKQTVKNALKKAVMVQTVFTESKKYAYKLPNETHLDFTLEIGNIAVLEDFLKLLKQAVLDVESDIADLQ